MRLLRLNPTICTRRALSTSAKPDVVPYEQYPCRCCSRAIVTHVFVIYLLHSVLPVPTSAPDHAQNALATRWRISTRQPSGADIGETVRKASLNTWSD